MLVHIVIIVKAIEIGFDTRVLDMLAVATDCSMSMCFTVQLLKTDIVYCFNLHASVSIIYPARCVCATVHAAILHLHWLCVP